MFFVVVFLDIIDDDEFKADSARKLSLIGHICMCLAHSNALHNVRHKHTQSICMQA